MDLQKIEDDYKSQGLTVVRQTDKPGFVYEPHRHGAVRLYTIKGSAKVKLDDQDWQDIEPGQEVIINDGQLHEAVAGPEGWEYIFASSPEEAERQGLL
jgi:quercetin dioxygenase-like cupin family protein